MAHRPGTLIYMGHEWCHNEFIFDCFEMQLISQRLKIVVKAWNVWSWPEKMPETEVDLRLHKGISCSAILFWSPATFLTCYCTFIVYFSQITYCLSSAASVPFKPPLVTSDPPITTTVQPSPRISNNQQEPQFFLTVGNPLCAATPIKINLLRKQILIASLISGGCVSFSYVSWSFWVFWLFSC